ncbi:MAG: DUF255 domain-containing protein [Saprospiraceae bacterium]|nr:DUF255 domain-containing protein [Saprospiraceae bacterium]
MHKLWLAFVFIGFTVAVSHGQSKVNWMTWEEAIEKNREDQRKIMVDIYTTWCTWCKKMENTTFQTEFIADYINENYYPVKFNAEQKEEIIYKGDTYKFVGGFGRKGYHELAAELMNGRLSYPTMVFLDENEVVIQPIPGFQDARTFEMIMVYFAENYYQSIPWQKFTRTFRSNNFSPRTTIGIKPSMQPVKNN